MAQKLLLVFLGFFVLFAPVVATVPVFAAEAPATVTNQKVPSVPKQVATRLKASWPWYITRGSGLIAAVTLVLLIVSGIGLLTGYTYRVLEPLLAWTTHRALGIAFLGSVAVHVIVLMFDKFAPFNVLQLLVPFVSKYQPATIGGMHVGSLWVASGILAFYGVIAVVVSSLLWIDKKPYTWRTLHYLSYAVMILTFVHGLFLGTDLKGGTYRVLWFMSGLLISVTVGLRLWRVMTISGGDKQP